MKKVSIKFRITLWFTTFMIVLTVGVIAVLSNVSTRVVKNNAKNALVETVESAAAALYEAGGMTDEFDDSIDGVSIVVYDEEGNLLGGTVPDGFTFNEETSDLVESMSITEYDELGEKPEEGSEEGKTKSDFSGDGSFGREEEKRVMEVKSEDESWYVYTINITLSSGLQLQVRGIVSCDGEYRTYEMSLKLFLFGLPVFIVLFGLGGYLLIYRAFRPINKIIEAAERIGESQNLSQRISLGEGTDEIHALAHAFDRMFDRLEGAFEKEKQFTSDASHELRTPTSVILSQCEFALENASTLEEAKEAIEKIMGQGKKMSSLISQLLMLARAEHEGKNLNFEQINISELAEIVTENQREVLDLKNITITEDISPALFVWGDETLLMRLLMNLIDNGVKYGKKNGHLDVHLYRDKDKIILTVTDDGIGIATENLNKIWDRFYQVDPSRNAANNSMGLGLSMVQWIARAHNGEVRAESQLGQGTTFTITLPAL